MKTSWLKGIVILLCALTVQAGEYADAFLEGGVTARGVALANTLGCLDYSESAFISNPAGLAYIKNVRLGLMYASQFGLANYNLLGGALPVSGNLRAAVGWIRFSVDDIPLRPDIVREVPDKEARRDTLSILRGMPVRTFSDAENAFFISVGKYNRTVVNLGWRYSKFGLEMPWGLNFKIIYKHLYNLQGFGLGVDWGGRLRVNGEELLDISRLGYLSVGLTLRDIAGTTIYWNSKRQDRIRPAAAISAALEQPLPKFKTQLNLGWAQEYRYIDKARLGVEVVYDQRLFLRIGLNNSGITTGIGLNFKVINRVINLDYAFYHHELGMNHRIGSSIVL